MFQPVMVIPQIKYRKALGPGFAVCAAQTCRYVALLTSPLAAMASELHLPLSTDVVYVAREQDMASIGYSLSSEEHRPDELIAFARRAEDTGFEYAMISDHFPPWIDSQGNS